MLTAHHLHRLPVDDDLNAIRARGKSRIETRVVLDAHRGHAQRAQLLRTLANGKSS